MNHNEESETVTEQSVEPDGHRPPKDTFLAILVNALDQNPGWEISVTLYVNGLIVSGLLCSMMSFFQEQAETIRELGSPESAGDRQELARAFDWIAEEIQDGQSRGDQAADTEAVKTDLPAFIHLRAATVHSPCTTTVFPEVLWRGRLEHVSGWSIGTFGPKPPPRRRTTDGQVSV